MLLILREEFVCLCVLLFLAFYYYIGKVKLNDTFFGRVIVYTILYVIFDMATVFVTNSMTTPLWVANTLHYMFYLLAILAGFSLYIYAIQMCKLYAMQDTLKKIGYVPILIYLIFTIFFPIEYVQGVYITYTVGTLVNVTGAIFLGFCFVSFILLFIFKDQLETRVKNSMFPLIFLLILFSVAQVIKPEMLMTSGIATILALGMFISIDNPDVKYKEQALWDFLTGLKNRNSYERDLIKYEHLNKPIGVLVADLNNLKTINDSYGHETGDLFISTAAHILKECLTSAEAVYRVGGDEFIAVFINPTDACIEKEINDIAARCLSVTSLPYLLEIAIGYQSNNKNIHDLIKMADKRMYEHKRLLKS